MSIPTLEDLQDQLAKLQALKTTVAQPPVNLPVPEIPAPSEGIRTEVPIQTAIPNTLSDSLLDIERVVVKFLQPVQESLSEIRDLLEANMKIKYKIEASGDDIDAVLAPLIKVVMTSYATVEEQSVAVADARLQAKTILNSCLYEAFKAGKKLGYTKGKKQAALIAAAAANSVDS